jgi:hypothetical protein
VGLVDFGQVFSRVSVELFHARFAAEFHFLPLMDFGDGRAHAAELVITDDAGV